MRRHRRFGLALRHGRIGLGLLLACASIGLEPTKARAVSGGTRPHYVITADVSLKARRVAGQMEATLTNGSDAALNELYLFLYPNRFAVEENDASGVDDVTRPFVYPYERFVPGAIAVSNLEVVDAIGQPLSNGTEDVERDGIPAGCLLRIPLRRPLAPGARAVVRASFTTTIPERFGPFGVFRKTLTALGGWHPYFPALGTNGEWLLDRHPPLSKFEVELTAEEPMELLLNGRHSAGGGAEAARLVASIEDAHLLSLVAAAELRRRDRSGEPRGVVLYQVPTPYSLRIGRGPDIDTLLLETLAQAAAGIDAPREDDPKPLVVVEAPLRMVLVHPGDGMVVVSDRALHIHRLLRPFHRRRLAQAIAYELVRAAVMRREVDVDQHWIADGLARAKAEKVAREQDAKERRVYDWINLFNVFAIVDRFETEPKIPFLPSLFDQRALEDRLRESVLTFNNELPPGSLVFAKLHQRLGDDGFDRLVEQYPTTEGDLAEQARRRLGLDLEELTADWLKPYPRLDYFVADARLNQPEGEGFRHEATIGRRSSRAVREPVEVTFDDRRGALAGEVWLASDRDESTGKLEARTDVPVSRVTIDPHRRLLEESRIDNDQPPSWQVVLDSADVTVTSTQLGAAVLGVARRRYDYRKDLALLGAFNERGIGFNAGGRLHWGPRIDANTYRHNLFGYYTYAGLDRGFKSDERPEVRTGGQMAGFGLRYDYSNVFGHDNPTRMRELRLFTDWYDDRVGGDYRFINWGIAMGGSHPLGTPRTLVAAQIMTGFTDPIDGSRIPNQGLYSLGGNRAIRGIGVDTELGENVFMLRTEIRTIVYPETDLNFMDWLVLRRGQLRFFVDTGNVDDDRGTLYRPADFAAGVGVGLAAIYDFMGFFPGLAYIEIAGRVDRFSGVDNGPQILLGTRQAF